MVVRVVALAVVAEGDVDLEKLNKEASYQVDTNDANAYQRHFERVARGE